MTKEELICKDIGHKYYSYRQHNIKWLKDNDIIERIGNDRNG